ncbi:glycosyltransferase family 2 protein [Alicyclobacillus macrosporangiidus]|uniref:Glycosyl transferase family 2 n=1 Tax=Alicyclobacillus macrosporangiidus TaxID=392015 RepID=A0A1I7FII4_9BACL|nr:glycosyltransferase family A protein [Alicyclobacillus macrosporangiidus]SFU35965.1 Glycosyl transferase family 2 [Alicyclobacillus macrosporangiidus]
MHRVSALVATRNRPDALAGCLEAMAAQTWRGPLEVIVVNDGGAPVDAVCAAFADRLDIHWVNLDAPVGQVAARNRALALARGDLAAFCDDDDRWLPGHVAALAEALLGRPDAVAAFTDTELVEVSRGGGGWQAGRRHVFAWRDPARLLQRYNPVVPSSLMYWTRVHEEIGGFDEAMSHYWDWDFLLRIARLGELVRVRSCLTLYAVDSAGTNQSANPERMSEARWALLEKHHLPDTGPSNFWRMCEDPDLANERDASERVWDGDPGIWTPLSSR